MKKNNLVLIGMPGAGKSTIGVVLAKRLGLGFIDTDLQIQARAGRRLQQIINQDGLAAFRRLEEEVVLKFGVCRAVIATGGSVVYSEKAMAHLAESGFVVFLDPPLEELEQRLQDMDDRGLVIEPGATLADLYRERLPLYRNYAEIVIDETGLSLEQVVQEICRQVPFRMD